MRNVLLGGRAGMRNGNCITFHTISLMGKQEEKNSISVSVGQYSQCLKQNAQWTGDCLMSQLYTGTLPRITTKWRVTSARPCEPCLATLESQPGLVKCHLWTRCLDVELQADNGCWRKKNEFLSRTSLLTDCAILSGHAWTHVHMCISKQIP